MTMRKVLIVDDEPSVRFVLARTCDRLGVPYDECIRLSVAVQALRVTGVYWFS